MGKFFKTGGQTALTKSLQLQKKTKSIDSNNYSAFLPSNGEIFALLGLKIPILASNRGERQNFIFPAILPSYI